jgi:hypothetical protein
MELLALEQMVLICLPSSADLQKKNRPLLPIFYKSEKG